MARRKFAAAAAGLLAIANAGAQPLADGTGCAALAERLESAVSVAVREYLRGAAARTPGDAASTDSMLSNVARWHTCDSTAAVASRAFNRAITALDVTLDWNDGWIRPGDYCLSHRLDQCYPSNNPLAALPRPDDFAFVHKTWQGVRQALASQMPYGMHADLTSFNDESLARALWTVYRPERDERRGHALP